MDNLVIKQELARLSENSPVINARFIGYVQPAPGFTLKHLEQKRVWRFAIRGHTGCVLEVIRANRTSYDDRGNSDKQKAEIPRWSVRLIGSHWQGVLPDNTRLPIGQIEEWSGNLETLFPKGEDDSEDMTACEGLLNMLGSIEAAIIGDGVETGEA